MAIKNTAWHAVEPGQIVSFRYKSEGSKRSYKRTVLILNPDMRYRKKSTGRIKRFVVGIQLDTAVSRPITETKLEDEILTPLVESVPQQVELKLPKLKKVKS